MQVIFYEDSFFYYFWKPAQIPSTFGQTKSFLDYLLESQYKPIIPIIDHLLSEFGITHELGLVNRLDTPTSGLLYFAKTTAIKEKYKFLQKNKKVEKKYLLSCYGNIDYYIQKFGNTITLPLAHHKFSKDRMVIVSVKTQHKYKGKIHLESTTINEFTYQKDLNISTVLVTIKKGIRHQIRAHFSAIGFPLIGDALYGEKNSHHLALYSIGLKVNEITH